MILLWLTVPALCLGVYRAARGEWALAALDFVTVGILVAALSIAPPVRRWRSANGRWPKRWEREQLKRWRGDR